VAAPNAGVLVTHHISVESEFRVNTAHDGYRYGDPMSSSTTVQEYKQGTLLIDLIDAERKQLVWRGTGQTRLRKSSTPEQREQRVREVVNAIMARYPPATAERAAGD
jgi:hypothetical protein